MLGLRLSSAKWPAVFLLACATAYGADSTTDGAPDPIEVTMAKDAPGLTKIAKDYDVWMDLKRKWVVVDGQVCLREGQLEMFACPKGTKEHESLITINCPPNFVHGGLLAIGAKQGTPVKFDPKYVPATGPIVDVYILWKDEADKLHKVRGQEWVKNFKTDKALDIDWVFAGSGFWKDEDTGKTHYHADTGDFICVSNFPTATLDLPVNSPQANSDLQFVAFTERIPPKGTKIRMVLAPRFEKKPEAPKTP